MNIFNFLISDKAQNIKCPFLIILEFFIKKWGLGKI